MKTCKHCKKEKEESEFSRNGKYLRNHCKKCQYQKHKDKYQSQKYKDYKKRYREDNKEKISQWHKEHYSQNRDRLLADSRRYYSQNSEKVCKRTKKYREENREWYNSYKREYRKNPINKLKSNMSRGLWGCLKGKQKQSKTFEYIGCTVDELWEHLESLFEEGMTRENYGEWHVDHIKPLHSFDFNNDVENQLKAAWNYTNLQPLWSKDNQSKGNKEGK